MLRTVGEYELLEEEAGERTEEGGGLVFLEVCSRRIQAIMYALLTG